jgi:hypothetical protein
MSKTRYLLLLSLAPCLGAFAQQSPAYAALPARPAAAPALANLPDCTDPRGLDATELQGDGFVLTWQGRPMVCI